MLDAEPRRAAPAPPRARWARPSLLAVLAIAAVCAPQQRAELDAAFTVTPADLASGGLALGAAVVALRERRRLPRRVLLLALPAVAVAAATIASPEVFAALPGFVRFLQIFVVIPLAVAVVVRDRTDRWLVAGSVLAAALVQAVLGCWQAATGTGASYGGQDIRAVGTFGAVDVMGMATVVSYGLIIALAIALSMRGRGRILAVLASVLLVAALVLSLSRGAWLACFVAGAVMVVLSGWRKVLALVSAGALVVLLMFATGWGSTTLKQRAASIADVSSQPDQSVNDRYGLWETAVTMWADRPALGVGPRGFAEFRDTYAPLHVSASSDTADPVNGFHRQELRSPHNMYLLVLSEQGLLGLSAFVLFWAALIIWSVRRGIRTRSGPSRAAALCAAGFLVWQLTDFVYADIGGAPTVIMSIMLGLLVSWATGSEGPRSGAARPTCGATTV
ncbi:O-antigen ligase family protein [Nonomuraea sp. NPDC050310]|uniref:O-antigen ligase family protein n=1 Tax=unclassified Nonomuraea TaxID=2593643 RepID=UPI00340A6DF0